MPHGSALFAGGIAELRRVAIRVRVLKLSQTRAGGHEYDCSGRDDMLLNHEHWGGGGYFNCNITSTRTFARVSVTFWF